MHRLALALVLLAGAAPQAEAQTWRTVTESRRHLGEDTLSVSVRFALGDLRIGAAQAPTLYRVGLVYDEETFEPDVRYDPRARRLTAGIRGGDDRGLRVNWHDRARQRLTLALSRDVAVRLDVEFGAGEASLDLGGLAMSSGRIRIGASETTVRFSEPNATACRSLSIDVGAAEFRVLELGNARCERIRIDGGVGEMTLDLTGAWAEGEHRVRADVGLGEIRVQVPSGAGVRLEIHRFLAGLDHPGFTKRGSYYYSADYDAAPVKLLIEVHAALGNIEIGWIEP